MKHIIFLGGYARAGKTTAAGILRDEFEIPVVSTSENLENITSTLFDKIHPGFTWKVLPKEEQRELKIFVAEKVLVPVYGRKVAIVKPAVDMALKALQKVDIVAIETIGGEEHRMFGQLLEGYAADITNINIRRHTERAGVDIRELLTPAEDIWNEGTIEDLGFTLSAIISYLEGTRP